MCYERLNNLKAEMVTAGVSMRECCDKLGLDYDRIGRMMNGYRPPDGDAIFKIQKYCKDVQVQRAGMVA